MSADLHIKMMQPKLVRRGVSGSTPCEVMLRRSSTLTASLRQFHRFAPEAISREALADYDFNILFFAYEINSKLANRTIHDRLQRTGVTNAAGCVRFQTLFHPKL